MVWAEPDMAKLNWRKRGNLDEWRSQWRSRMPAGTGNREDNINILIIPRVQMEKSLKALPVAYLGQCSRLAYAVQRPMPLQRTFLGQ